MQKSHKNPLLPMMTLKTNLLEMREVCEVACDLVDTNEPERERGWDWSPEVLMTTSGPSGSDTKGLFLKWRSDMVRS